jgi:hypothetical protein
VYGLGTTGLGIVMTLLTYTKTIPGSLAIGLAIAYFPILLALLWLVQYRAFADAERIRAAQQKSDALEREKAVLEREKARLEREATATSSGLIAGTLKELSEAMRHRLWKLDEVNRRVQDALASSRSDPSNLLSLFDGGSCDERNITYDLLTTTMARLCEVFERDSYADTKTKYGSSVFKATLFVPVHRDGKTVLVRDAYKYPGGLSPRTREIDPDQHPRATAVISFKTAEMVVVEDIEKERSTDKPDQVRWDDLYTGQHLNYKSMVSTYVSKGAPRSPERETVAILTIDTNRPGYFREEEEWKKLLATVLTPFRIYIALLYEMRRSHELLLHGLRQVAELRG